MKPDKLTYPRDTLGFHYRMAEALFGPGAALDYLARKASETPRGFDEPVIAAESQVIMLLAHLHFTGGDA